MFNTAPWRGGAKKGVVQEEVSARDVARAALEQLTEVLGARHGTGQALMLPALGLPILRLLRPPRKFWGRIISAKFCHMSCLHSLPLHARAHLRQESSSLTMGRLPALPAGAAEWKVFCQTSRQRPEWFCRAHCAERAWTSSRSLPELGAWTAHDAEVIVQAGSTESWRAPRWRPWRERGPARCRS